METYSQLHRDLFTCEHTTVYMQTYRDTRVNTRRFTYVHANTLRLECKHRNYPHLPTITDTQHYALTCKYTGRQSVSKMEWLFNHLHHTIDGLRIHKMIFNWVFRNLLRITEDPLLHNKLDISLPHGLRDGGFSGYRLVLRQLNGGTFVPVIVNISIYTDYNVHMDVHMVGACRRA